MNLNVHRVFCLYPPDSVAYFLYRYSMYLQSVPRSIFFNQNLFRTARKPNKSMRIWTCDFDFGERWGAKFWKSGVWNAATTSKRWLQLQRNIVCCTLFGCLRLISLRHILPTAEWPSPEENAFDRVNFSWPDVFQIFSLQILQDGSIVQQRLEVLRFDAGDVPGDQIQNQGHGERVQQHLVAIRHGSQALCNFHEGKDAGSTVWRFWDGLAEPVNRACRREHWQRPRRSSRSLRPFHQRFLIPAETCVQADRGEVQAVQPVPERQNRIFVQSSLQGERPMESQLKASFPDLPTVRSDGSQRLLASCSTGHESPVVQGPSLQVWKQDWISKHRSSVFL